MNDPDMWREDRPDGTTVRGFEGSDWHIHDIDFGRGVITVQSTDDHFPFDNFNRDVDELLPPEWRIQS